jgi:hypothetical protein
MSKRKREAAAAARDAELALLIKRQANDARRDGLAYHELAEDGVVQTINPPAKRIRRDPE